MDDDKDLNYIDFFILDTIHKCGVFRDHDLSRELHYPRIALLNRLTDMLSSGLVCENAGKYYLTHNGLSKWISLDEFCNLQLPPVNDISAESFDWTNLYIPNKGWDT